MWLVLSSHSRKYLRSVLRCTALSVRTIAHKGRGWEERVGAAGLVEGGREGPKGSRLEGTVEVVETRHRRQQDVGHVATDRLVQQASGARGGVDAEKGENQ